MVLVLLSEVWFRVLVRIYTFPRFFLNSGILLLVKTSKTLEYESLKKKKFNEG